MTVSTSAREAVSPIVNPQVQSISVASDGSVFATDSKGVVIQSTDHSQPWTPASQNEPVGSLSVSDQANLVFGIANGVPVVSPVGPNLAFKPVTAKQSPKCVQLEVGAADGSNYLLWAIDASGELWRYSSAGDSWEDISSAVEQMAVTSDGAVYLLMDAFLYSYDSSGWTDIPIPEPVADISAGAEDYLWMVGRSGAIYQYDPGQGNSWQQVAPPRAGVGTLSVGDDTNVWLLQTGAIYQYQPAGNNWAQLPWSGAAPPAHIALANLNLAYAVDAKGNAYQYTEFANEWEPIDGSSLPPLKQVSASDAHDLWGVDSSGGVHFFHNTGSGFQPVAVKGKLAMVAVAGSNTIWGVDSQGVTYQWWSGQFVPRSNSPVMAAVSAGSTDHIAALDTAGNAYQRQGSSWQQVPSGTPFIAIDIDGNGLMRAIDKGNVLWMYLGEWIQTGTKGLTQVSASPAGDVWGITTQGQPVHLSDPEAHLEAAARARRVMPQWDAESVFDEAQSTHLWIVNRAANLAQQQGTYGQKVCGLVKPFKGRLGDLFHDNLCQGLYDADFLPAYNNPVGGLTTYMSHFYDPDTGLNWLHASSPTGLTNGSLFYNQAASYFKAGDMQNAGYNLGLAMHYMTDLTQPMHAANFTWLSSSPRPGYHTAFEGYIMETQGRVRPPATYVASNLGTAPGPYLIATAKNSKSKYYDPICPHWAFWNYWSFTSYYQGIADKYRQGMLSDAIVQAAQFLVAWMQAASSGERSDGALAEGDRHSVGA